MHVLESLLEKAENYAKTSVELYKLNEINKSADIISTSLSRGIAIIFFSLFIITANIGVAFLLGEVLGKIYYGFFCVAGFYGFIGIFVYFFLHNYLKRRVNNSIISQLQN